MTGSHRNRVACLVASGHGLRAVALSAIIAISIVPELAAQTAKKAIAVEAVTVAPTQLVETVSAIGSLRSNEAAVIRSEINGRIVEIGFEEGRPVEKGDLLFRLDDTIYQAELAEADARRGLSERTYERAKALENRGHGSVETLDRALAQMRVDRASVKLVRARLEKTNIHAPFDGIVGFRKVSIGDYVEAGDDLVNLEDIDPLKVEFRLPERYLRVVRPDGQVRVQPDALPGQSFEGQIYAIDPLIDPAGRSISIRARIANQGQILRPGLFARVSLIVGHDEKALVVPEQAIVRRGDRQFVYRVVGDVAALTPVTLGLRQTGRVEVVDGLTAGDTVVTAGHAKLREGSRVEITRSADTRG